MGICGKGGKNGSIVFISYFCHDSLNRLSTKENDGEKYLLLKPVRNVRTVFMNLLPSKAVSKKFIISEKKKNKNVLHLSTKKGK